MSHFYARLTFFYKKKKKQKKKNKFSVRLDDWKSQIHKKEYEFEMVTQDWNYEQNEEMT